jgi:transposase InsO family protein
VKANQANYPVKMMCELLSVSRSGAYAWAGRPRSPHARRDVELAALVRTIHERSHGTYGAPRIHAELSEAYGERVGMKRVARLMRAAGLAGVQKRRFVRTTVRDGASRGAPDLVERHFTASRPDALWVADATYIATWEGFSYLAIVLDACTRLVVGWAMENHLRTELMLTALERAYRARAPHGVIHHSDHGCQYTSIAFGQRCKELGVRPSMGSVGDAYDNAMAESFFSSFECEVLDRNHFRTRKDAYTATFRWIEGWYNPHRRHSSLGYLSPRQFEERLMARHIKPGASGALRASDRACPAVREKAKRTRGGNINPGGVH